MRFMGKLYTLWGNVYILGFRSDTPTHCEGLLGHLTSYLLHPFNSNYSTFSLLLDLIHHGTFISKRNVAVA